jgi:hypothetical protein
MTRRFINTHIEHPTLRLNTRLSPTHKQGARAIAVRRPLVDTDVITTHTVVLTRGGREREREREREHKFNYEHSSWTWPANNRISQSRTIN